LKIKIIHHTHDRDIVQIMSINNDKPVLEGDMPSKTIYENEKSINKIIEYFINRFI